MEKRIYNFEVETKECGQRRAYGDSYYHYIVKSENVEFIVQEFCRKIVRHAPILESEVKAHVEKVGFAGHFTTYVTSFKKIGDNEYEYKCVQPSTD